MRGSFSFSTFACKAVSMLICLFLVIGCFPFVVFADDSNPISENDFDGSGTQYDPYLINDYEDLCLFRDLVDEGNRFFGKYFVQTEDISIPDGIIWDGIGNRRDDIAFSGIYNGKGHTINNLFCDEEFAGLFSYLNGQIWNLGIESGYINGVHSGAIASQGYYKAKIVNCYNRAEVHGVDSAGGITDKSYGFIMFCLNLGCLSGESSDTVTAGISAKGGDTIRFCYTSTDNLVNDATFSGIVIDSYTSSDLNSREYLDFYYEMMFSVYSEQKYSDYSYENEKRIASINFGEQEDDEDLIVFKNWGNIYVTSEKITYHGININRENIVFLTGEDIHFDSSYEPSAFVDEKELNKDSFVDLYDQRYDFEGEGTEADPFKINSYEDLCLLRDCVNINVSYKDYYFVLTDDIYFEDENWIPIGLPNIADGFPNRNDKGRSFTGFYGTLNGNGHSIYNLKCESMFAGLFGYLDGKVVNLGIESGEIRGNYSGSITCCSGTNAEIINCYNKASVFGNYRAGGISDYYRGKVIYCWNLGSVEGSSEHSTIASICSFGSAQIIDSYAVGELSIISDTSFTGILERSGNVDSYNGEEYKSYNELINEGILKETKLLRFNYGDDISFSNEVVSTGLFFLRFIPHLILAVFVVVGFILILCSGKKIVFEKHKDKISHNDSFKSSAKTKIKRAFCIVLTLTLLAAELHVTTATLQNKNTSGITTMQNYYLQDNVDVLLLGNSRIGLNIDGEVLWNEYGLNSYNLWGSVAPMWNSYYYLKEAIDVNKPKIVVLETNSITFADFDYRDEYFQIVNTIAIRNPINRFEATMVSCENDKVIDFMLKLPLFHERVFELKENDFNHYYWTDNLAVDKGFHTNYLEQINKQDSGIDVVNYYAIPEKELYYLEGIIDICENNDIPLIFIKSQIPENAIQQPFFNTLSLIAEENDIPFINFNFLNDELDFSITDFGDGHLNTKGARKNSEYLGQYIVDNYPDLVGNNDNSWNITAADIQDSYIQRITDNNDYFAELERDNKEVWIVNYLCENEESKNYEACVEQLESLDYHSIDDFEIGQGDESIFDISFGSHSILFTPEYESLSMELDSGDCFEINSRCLVVIVYDEVTDEIADISYFSATNKYQIKHLYPYET